MTAPSGIQLAVGTRYACVFELDTTYGTPKATNTTAYMGVSFQGPKAFALTVSEPRKIAHVGGDRLLAMDFLPTLEPSTAELRVPHDNQVLDALLTDVTRVTSIGEASMLATQTDKQGYEPTVALLLYQQSVDSASRLRRWRSFLIPRCRIIPLPGGMGDNPEDTRYMVAITPTTQHVWGTAMTEAKDGAIEAQIIRMMTEGLPRIATFIGDNTEDEFLFPVDQPALSAAKVWVWVNDVEVTAAITKTTTKVTFTTPPAASARVVIFYEM
jgi:hypothetical protein